MLQQEKFPTDWTEGFISPIFKSGSQYETNNYRGITIANCLRKLFTKLLNGRLVHYLTENNIIKNNQFGVMPKCSTSDHLLVLETIIDIYKRKKKTLFLCFIDFRKVFDSIYRDGLIFKLKQSGISSKFICLIISMYQTVNARMKTQSGVTNSFPIEVGTC